MLKCPHGHSFDFAKEGYCNLLLVQQKGSKDPGDGKEMVAARTRFLSAGHYAPVAAKLFSFVERLAHEFEVLRLVDAGCGEGYYLNEVSRLAKESAASSSLELSGFDISKWAVRAAAKRGVPASWVVASNRQLPYAKESIDLLLSMFGFAVWDSFRNAQPKGGRVLLVDPGPEHLLELRQAIYPSVEKRGQPSLDVALSKGYELESEDSLHFTFHLKSAQEIQDLVSMTPHAYRMSEAGEESLKALSELSCTGDVVFRLLKKA